MILNVDKINILVYRHSGITHNHNKKYIFRKTNENGNHYDKQNKPYLERKINALTHKWKHNLKL